MMENRRRDGEDFRSLRGRSTWRLDRAFADEELPSDAADDAVIPTSYGRVDEVGNGPPSSLAETPAHLTRSTQAVGWSNSALHVSDLELWTFRTSTERLS